MKIIMVGVIVLVLFVLCGNSNKIDVDFFVFIIYLVDLVMVNKIDFIDREKILDEFKLIEVDELFDDFIYNFVFDDVL